MIHTLIQSPKKLFLIDGVGALVSAFLLGLVLVELDSIFNIPHRTLYLLALFPCVFAVYDIVCYLVLKNKIGLFLKIIALMNLGYCFISILLAFYHLEIISIFAWIYIIMEVFLIFGLIALQIYIANKIK